MVDRLPFGNRPYKQFICQPMSELVALPIAHLAVSATPSVGSPLPTARRHHGQLVDEPIHERQAADNGLV
jgi:hypothetical protein